MNYFNDIDNIPYWNWLQVRGKEDLRYMYELDSYLNLSNIEVSEQAKEAYKTIESQYNEIVIMRPKAQQYFDKDVNILELDSERFDCLLLVSQIQLFHSNSNFQEHVKQCANDLNNYGYEVNLSGNVIEQCNTITRQLDGLITEIQEIEKSKEIPQQSTSTQGLLNQIEKYRKVPIDAKNISLLQYLEYESDYIKYLEDASNKKK